MIACLAVFIAFMSPAAAAAAGWAAAPPMPESLLNLCAAGLGGGQLLAAGGFGYPPVAYFASALRYDAPTRAWSRAADMAVTRDSFACAVLDGLFYAVGGESETWPFTLNATERYDPRADAWRPAGNLTTARSGHAAAALGGSIYAAGGIGVLGVPFASAERFDPGAGGAAGAWRPIASMTVARYYFGVAAAAGKLWAAGGLTHAAGGARSVLASVEAFDPATGAWSVRAALRLPAPRERFGIAVWGGRELYLLGGCSTDCIGDQGLEQSVIRADVGGGDGNGAWAAAPDLPVANGWFGVGVVNNSIMVVGGGTAVSRNASFLLPVADGAA